MNFIERKINAIKRKYRNAVAINYIKNNGLINEAQIFTHMTLYELVSIHKLLKNNNIEVALEIGSYLGASSTFIANAIKETGKLYCIDTWGNDFMDYKD